MAAVDALKSLLRWLSGGRFGWLTMVSWILTVAVNMVLAAALLGAVPRLRISPGAGWCPVLVVAVGFTLLNTVGRYYVAADRQQPGVRRRGDRAVGLLVYLYLLQPGAALGRGAGRHRHRGNVIDLAADPSRQQQEDTFQQRLAEENRRSDHQDGRRT